MADKRIPDFATAAALDDDDLFLISADNDTYNIRADKVAQKMLANTPDMLPATAQTAGARGLVPAPAATKQNAVLHGDAQWRRMSASNVVVERIDQDIDAETVQEALEQLAEAIPGEMVGATSQTDGAAGLVPAPESADRNKVLKGSGSWQRLNAQDIDVQVQNLESDNVQDALDKLYDAISTAGGTIPVMQPASSSADGAAGLVPKPLQNQQDKVLLGSGWGWMQAGNVAAQTVGNIQSDNVQGVLNALYTLIPGVMTGATEQTAGTAGSVPAPPRDPGYRRYLRSDGTWHELEAIDLQLNDPQAINGQTPDNAEEAIWMLNGYIDTLVTQINTALAQVVGGGSNAQS